MRIERMRVTPIAFKDPPLLNVVGVHQPYALRSIIELETDKGLVGLGETYGDSGMLADLERVREAVLGLDPFDLNGLITRIREVIVPQQEEGMALAPGTHGNKAVSKVFSALEVPCLDLQGQATNRPVVDLLGGAVRDKVPYSAYLFYKFARHKDFTVYPADTWGEALTPEGIVTQAQGMIKEYGFKSIKLKGGVFQPELEIESIKALHAAFPKHPLRLDPNAGWTVETSIRAGRALDGILEYLEDPTPGLKGMAAVAREVSMPLATNMVVTAFSDLPEAVALGSVGVVLSDHHYWGGLRPTHHLAVICATWGMELSMHSNSHLGISLAAMTHLAASLPTLSYACDTHYPWQEEEVVEGGRFSFEDGSLKVPEGPGLGVKLDPEALARLHQQYLDCGIKYRDDTTEMLKYDPNWDATCPRF